MLGKWSKSSIWVELVIRYQLSPRMDIPKARWGNWVDPLLNNTERFL